MKILGQNLGSNYIKPYSLERADGTTLLFQLSPLPLGFQVNLRRFGIVPPVAPLKVARDSGGKPLRDPAGHALTYPDPGNREYLTDVERYHQRVAILAVVEALRNDPQIVFESQKPQPSSETESSWIEYADAIFREFEDSGITIGELTALCDEIGSLSHLIDRQIAETQKNF